MGQGGTQRDGGGCVYVMSRMCVPVYLELDTDILRHELDRGFFEDPVVPATEDLQGQDALRFVNSEASIKRL